MDWLMDREPHQTVISIIGMGGSGKTTLAANTYNNDDVKKHFDCCAWITISQAYELEDVLRSLIKEFHDSRNETIPADLNSMNYRLLVKTLVNYLEKKRYLLVLDDVWDTNLLDEIKLLQNEEAWELFCKKAFINCTNGSCPLSAHIVSVPH
ncbi:disease resistance protein RPM1-like [Quercus suber]|uniref:disease resistance protein RPM1-like n=1 Tax=Quercus suber TaxID=58331 RepID=UPI0032DF41BB